MKIAIRPGISLSRGISYNFVFLICIYRPYCTMHDAIDIWHIEAWQPAHVLNIYIYTYIHTEYLNYWPLVFVSLGHK